MKMFWVCMHIIPTSVVTHMLNNGRSISARHSQQGNYCYMVGEKIIKKIILAKTR